MTFVRLTRPEGKGSLILNGGRAVLIFDARGKTVVRTTAGGENTSFVVTESAEDVVNRLSSQGMTFIKVARRSDSRVLFINADQVAGVYERTGLTMVRTTAAGEHAEYTVLETLDAVEKMLPSK